MRQLLPSFPASPRRRNVSEEEYQRLLSDVDEGDDEEGGEGTNVGSGMTRLPTTFASLVTTPPYSDNPSS